MSDSLNINSIDSLYKALIDRDELKAKVLLMLMLRNWLTTVSNFDHVTGHVLATGIVDFMEKIAQINANIDHPENEIKDRVYRIVSHSKEAVSAILRHIPDKILREHAMLPIHAAREVDSISVQWLSRQPGRTFREKLSGRPYIKAVKRRTSVDTSENRLLKTFFFRLEQILIERQAALSTTSEETCEKLLVLLQRWLISEESAEIGQWGNLPPNNTLLQDKRYRKVWDGWLWLQSLDENIKADSKTQRFHHDILSVIYWETVSLLNQTGQFRTVQQPISIDYDKFVINPELPIKGYLFPTCDSKIKGQIRNINYEKMFGFLTTENGTTLFFHKNNLLKKLDINSLKAGDVVSFDIGSNNQGECADKIQLTTSIEPIELNLLSGRFHIRLGKKTLYVQIRTDYINLTQQPDNIEKNFQLDLSVIKNVPKAILSFLLEVPSENFNIAENHNSSEKIDQSVVDLCSIRPRFTSNTGSQIILPFRLLQQKWKTEIVDCGTAKAIAFSSDIETVSMRSLFSVNSKLSDAEKSHSAMFFIKKLNDYIPTKNLFYLIPDWANDFDLECIRKSINFYFENSTPLPKSIAATFAWQSSKKFVQDKVRENDFVLVIDSFYGGISITPVQAVVQKELGKLLPESQGISWERHPAMTFDSNNIQDAMVRSLTQNGCQISDELIQLFGFDGLISDAGKISFVNDDNWYHLSNTIREILNHDLDENLLTNQAIRDCLNSVNKEYQGVSVFILPLDETIKKPPLDKNYNWLGSVWSPIKGCQTLTEWQEKVSDIALWRDHLPELSIKILRNGSYENFYLVKDATVTPLRGKAVSIPVKELFTLPAGQSHYSFPLQQGEGAKKLHFVAYLKSPAFPLKKDDVCKLQMTYTYGADDSYELKFIPLDSEKAGFKSIRVEWRSASEAESTDLESLPVPDFPARKSWSDFQKFPREDGAGFSDLLDWMEGDIQQIIETANFVNGDEPHNRIYDDEIIDCWDWKEDRNGKQFSCLSYDFGDVFFHESNFEKFDPEAEEVSFDLEKQKERDGYVARNVTLGRTIPKKITERFRKSLRFPVLTIWNNGHSLSEPDAPDYFRKTVYEGINKAIVIINSENMPDTLKEELFFSLCCLHKDAPEIVKDRLLDAIKDKILLRKYNKNIAFAIGNAEFSWQQELLESVIDPVDNEGLTRSITMEMLSIALWRSKELISKLTENKLEVLAQNLYCCIEFDFQKVKEKNKDYRQILTLCKHLELLLALLRTRETEDEKIKMFFAPDRELTKQYVALVDNISKLVMDNNIELKSRISLQIEKPEIFHNTPDLLYALRMYLTGDSGANTIAITGISGED